MVFYSRNSKADLKNIFDGLLTWSKHKLEYNHVVLYHNDIIDICESLGSKSVHFNTRYNVHKQYGEKVHTYRRSKQTTRYIIYNVDQHGNVYIQKIISNYSTIAGTK
jgi:plasmid stabilization system protein ParE